MRALWVGCVGPLWGHQLYETVNNLPNHYVGMHTELTALLAPRHAAFVCFQPADVGGEFLLLDGRCVWQELEEGVLSRMVQRGIRFKVAGFDFRYDIKKVALS